MNSDLSHVDILGRSLRYVRFSVTDRCNLRCLYCVNKERQHFIPHAKIIRYEQFIRLASIFSSLGAGKIRITGGEPLMRKGLTQFLARLRRKLPDLQVAITTNATLLPDCLTDLAALKLCSFNISLDSLDAASYEHLTGKNALAKVLASIEKLISLGQKVKINAVAMRGISDREMPEFMYFLKHTPVDLRFIEYMPMGGNTAWNENCYIGAPDLLALARQTAAWEPVFSAADPLAGPARLYQHHGMAGKLGFISAISDHFCHVCQRMRVTSEGNLRPCLFADKEMRLASLLNHPKIDDAHIARVIRESFKRKPIGAHLLAARKERAVAGKQMVGIGG